MLCYVTQSIVDTKANKQTKKIKIKQTPTPLAKYATSKVWVRRHKHFFTHRLASPTS